MLKVCTLFLFLLLSISSISGAETIKNWEDSGVDATVGEVTASDGTSLSYAEFGDAETSNATMVLVHGWISAKEFWNKQVKDLVDSNVHVIAYDYRNHGESGPSRDLNSTYADAMAKMSISGLASDLRDIIHAFDLDQQETPITLVGHSMGGMVIMKALEIFGHDELNVGSVALVDSSLTEFAPDAVPEEQRSEMGAETTNSMFLEMLASMGGPNGTEYRNNLYSTAYFTKDLSSEELETVEEYLNKAPLEPSIALGYSVLGTYGNGNAMIDIAINNALGAGVPVLGIALRPSAGRGYRYTTERKEEASVGGCDFKIVDLSEGFPDDNTAHFAFWQEETKDTAEAVTEALVDFAHNSLSDECAELPEGGKVDTGTGVEMTMTSTAASVHASSALLMMVAATIATFVVA